MHSLSLGRHRRAFATPMTRAFTIVELIIVITVIAILATVTVVGYQGVLNNGRETTMKSDLQQTYAKLKSYVNTNDTYPSTLGANAVQSQGVSLDYGASPDGTSFCLNATRSDSSSAFNIKNSGVISQGACGTPSRCIAFNSASQQITNYYSNVDNDASKASCPKDVYIPDSIAGVDVLNIGDQAFYQKYITSVRLPSKLQVIGVSSFANNSLAKVIIPDSVSFIRQEAFSNNYLTSVTLSASLSNMEDFAFAYNHLSYVVLPKSLGAGGVAIFSGNGNLTCQIGSGSPYLNTNAYGIGCSSVVVY